MNDINIISAFLFGMLAFFSPCTFPLIPSFLSFMLGISVGELEDSVYTKEHRNMMLAHVGMYILGSSSMLVVLGGTFGLLSKVIHIQSILLSQIGGVIVIFFGLSILGFVKFPFATPQWVVRVSTRLVYLRKERKASLLLSFLLGIIFSIAWIPCISPILGAILILAASGKSTLYGGILLFVYSIGLNFPLFLVSFILSSYLGYFTFIRKHVYKLSYITGILLILLGVCMVIGKFSLFVQFFYNPLSFIKNY